MTTHFLTVGMRLQMVRKQVFMSQREVAVRAGIARNTVSNIELDDDAKLSTLQQLSDALDVPLDAWFVPDSEWLEWLQGQSKKALGKWVKLEDLPPGFVFVTQDGILAVKSEYHLTGGQCMCVLLASGEYAHFLDGNDTMVQALGVTQ